MHSRGRYQPEAVPENLTAYTTISLSALFLPTFLFFFLLSSGRYIVPDRARTTYLPRALATFLRTVRRLLFRPINPLGRIRTNV